MPVTLASICVLLSATRSAPDTTMLKVPSASTVPGKAAPLTLKVTVSPAANLPVTLPVTVMLPAASVLLMMLSAVTGSRLMAVSLPAVLASSTT